MTLAIIGTGNMGSGLAKRLAQAGIEVAIGARDPAKAVALANTVGNGAQGSGVAAAAKLAEVIVLAVPYGSTGDTLEALGDVSGKVLVDLSNPVTPDFMSLALGHTTSAAEEIQKLVPKARVVKAFNTIFAQLLEHDRQGGEPRVQVFYATDDGAAGDLVARFIHRIGFEPVFAGSLRNARFLEPVGALNINFGYALGWGTLVAPAWIKVAG